MSLHLSPKPSDPSIAVPSISVIMPVYNGAAFLDRAFASLTAQTFANFEVIAVDDASIDDSAQGLAAFAASDSRVRVYFHDSNRGQAAARNTALNAAQGGWIAYLDQDDEFAADHFAHVWEWRHKADVLLFRYDLIEERPGFPRLGLATPYDPSARSAYMFRETIAVPLGVVHRQALLERVGKFNEAMGRFRGQDEDGDLWRRFAKAGASFIGVPHSSGRYHVRADSFARTRPMPPSTSPSGDLPPGVFAVDVARDSAGKTIWLPQADAPPVSE